MEIDAVLCEPPRRVEHAEPSEELGEEGALDDDDFHVETSQAPVGGRDEFPRPPHAALVHARRPEEARRYHAAAEAEFLDGFENPVDGAADADAVFAGTEEEEVGEC